MWTQNPLRRKRLLSERQATLIDKLRMVLQRLAEALDLFGPDATPADKQALQNTQEQLSQLFLLVIVGEFNSGKSSFLNALLGGNVQPEGVTPTTDRITLLRYGEEPTEDLRESSLLERTHPANVLRHLTIVDTPGTNAVIRRHEELTRTFMPRADLVLFTTSVDRPFTESERAFISVIKEWGKKIVLVLNKCDILEEGEIEQVVDFVRRHAYDLLGTEPEIFPVSARLAQRARTSPDSEVLWRASRFAAIERYIIETLDEEERTRLKLLSPLGVAEHLTNSYLKMVEDRLKVLQDDFHTLDNIERQLGLFRDDLVTDVQHHLNEMDMILRDLEERGTKFFDDNLQLRRIPNLIRTDHLRSTFEKEVVGDVSQQIEQRIQFLVDWTVEKNLRLWQNITDYISRRRAPQYRDGIIGEVGSAFDYNRNALLDSVGRTARSVINSYDREHEAQILVEDVQSSLVNTALTEVGALGIGALLVMLLHGALLDATGIFFAAALAFGGAFILPAKRRQSKQAFSERVNEMRDQIRETVRMQFEKETEQSLARIREAISPYTRFVRTKREQITKLQHDLSDIDVALERLRTEIEG